MSTKEDWPRKYDTKVWGDNYNRIFRKDKEEVVEEEETYPRYSDIMSDGGMDPRAAYEEERRPVQLSYEDRIALRDLLSWVKDNCDGDFLDTKFDNDGEVDSRAVVEPLCRVLAPYGITPFGHIPK